MYWPGHHQVRRGTESWCVSLALVSKRLDVVGTWGRTESSEQCVSARR
jgi:hypothetical protein